MAVAWGGCLPHVAGTFPPFEAPQATFLELRCVACVHAAVGGPWWGAPAGAAWPPRVPLLTRVPSICAAAVALRCQDVGAGRLTTEKWGLHKFRGRAEAGRDRRSPWSRVASPGPSSGGPSPTAHLCTGLAPSSDTLASGSAMKVDGSGCVGGRGSTVPASRTSRVLWSRGRCG